MKKLVFSIVIVTMLVISMLSASSYAQQASGVVIINSAYKVNPGTYNYIPFNLTCSGIVSGSFSAEAGLGDNIMVFVLDQNNFNSYQSGTQSSASYASGKVPSGSFNLNLGSGNYYIVLSNTYSTFSTKTVSLQVSYSCNSDSSTPSSSNQPSSSSSSSGLPSTPYYYSNLVLDSIPSVVNSGDTITFSGTLFTQDGKYVISGKTIYIKDDIAFATDTVLGTVVTDNTGKFHATWKATPKNNGNTYNF